MSTIVLIFSGILFVVTLGIHLAILSSKELDKPLYIRDPILSILPWIAGLVLPVFVWVNVTGYNWIVLFFINIAVVYILGPLLTAGFVARFSRGKGLGGDMILSFVLGIIALLIGFVLK